MKNLILLTAFIFSSLNAFAEGESVLCTSKSFVRSIAGTVDRGVLNSTVTIHWQGEILKFENVQYKVMNNVVDSYLLMDNEVTLPLKSEGIQLFFPRALFVNNDLNHNQSWFPFTDERGKADRMSISYKMHCERN